MSRGWTESDVEELAAKGFDPVTAPGPGEGDCHSDAFRRTGPGVFEVKGAAGAGDRYLCDEVFTAVCGLGRLDDGWRRSLTSGGGAVFFLDGQLLWDNADDGCSVSPTMELRGNRALRLVCSRLGLRQPRQLLDEDRVPRVMELEAELLGQVYRTSGLPMPKPPPTGLDLLFSQWSLPSQPQRQGPSEPELSPSGMQFVELLFEIRRTDDFLIVVREYDGEDSLERVIGYLEGIDSGVAGMVLGAIEWLTGGRRS